VIASRSGQPASRLATVLGFSGITRHPFAFFLVFLPTCSQILLQTSSFKRYEISWVHRRAVGYSTPYRFLQVNSLYRQNSHWNLTFFILFNIHFLLFCSRNNWRNPVDCSPFPFPYLPFSLYSLFYLSLYTNSGGFPCCIYGSIFFLKKSFWNIMLISC